MLQVSRLFIYPIKSLGGIEVASARVTDRGFEHDRRWMLVDTNNRFLSQREFGQMALIRTAVTDEGIAVQHVHHPGKGIIIPFKPQSNEDGIFTIWDDTCYGQYVSDEADEWFSEMLQTTCRLVYMPDQARRLVEEKYRADYEITSFSDAYPFLILGEATLETLNSKLDEKVPLNRFRPNIVFTGGNAHDEDTMAQIAINGIQFYGVKLCARCNIITINQETAEQSKEPTRTLATYRAKNNKIYFGQNLLHKGQGRINVGDSITQVQIKESLFK
jgi:uncharacterized protein YcbX